MDTREVIDSGDLELYVYGLLDERETKRIASLAEVNPEIQAEIISIEKSILNLSSSFSPQISSDLFEKIKAKLELKHGKVITMKPGAKKFEYLGWVASIALLAGIGFQYFQMTESAEKLNSIELKNSKLEQSVVELEKKEKRTQTTLSVIRDTKNTVVTLAGQAIDPNASAKVYWNKEKQTVYVDAAGLPEPPKGMVYQVWALKLSPFTPTSIGLLDEFEAENNQMFALDNTAETEAFGITLEPAGGSRTPTLEKLYTLGKV